MVTAAQSSCFQKCDLVHGRRVALGVDRQSANECRGIQINQVEAGGLRRRRHVHRGRILLREAVERQRRIIDRIHHKIAGRIAMCGDEIAGRLRRRAKRDGFALTGLTSRVVEGHAAVVVQQLSNDGGPAVLMDRGLVGAGHAHEVRQHAGGGVGK